MISLCLVQTGRCVRADDHTSKSMPAARADSTHNNLQHSNLLCALMPRSTNTHLGGTGFLCLPRLVFSSPDSEVSARHIPIATLMRLTSISRSEWGHDSIALLFQDRYHRICRAFLPILNSHQRQRIVREQPDTTLFRLVTIP